MLKSLSLFNTLISNWFINWNKDFHIPKIKIKDICAIKNQKTKAYRQAEVK